MGENTFNYLAFVKGTRLVEVVNSCVLVVVGEYVVVVKKD